VVGELIFGGGGRVAGGKAQTRMGGVGRQRALTRNMNNRIAMGRGWKCGCSLRCIVPKDDSKDVPVSDQPVDAIQGWRPLWAGTNNPERTGPSPDF